MANATGGATDGELAPEVELNPPRRRHHAFVEFGRHTLYLAVVRRVRAEYRRSARRAFSSPFVRIHKPPAAGGAGGGTS
jgi:hypothetical protein